MKDLLVDYTYQQVVKTKKNENVVDIIDSENFFELLEGVGLVKSKISKADKDSIESLVCLDPQYKSLLLIKKIQRAIEELLRNENLCSEILEWRDEQGPSEDEG